jgi:hypothetical protein
MSVSHFAPSTESTDETADDLVARLMNTIHEHALSSPAPPGGPEINGPLVMAALARVSAELVLNLPSVRQRDELVAFHDSVLRGVLHSAATGETVDLTFAPSGATH